MVQPKRLSRCLPRARLVLDGSTFGFKRLLRSNTKDTFPFGLTAWRSFLPLSTLSISLVLLETIFYTASF